MLTFKKKFLLLTIILLVIELLIALFVRDPFVRPYVGDYLVVILLYCALRTIFITDVCRLALGVLLFSYFIEMLQYFQLINILGLENNVVVKTVIGYGFEWRDLLAYTLGVLTILAFEKFNYKAAKGKQTIS